jgi:hypothetical protein
MKRFILVAIFLALAFSQPYPGCPGTPNNNSAVNAKPVLLKSVTNGKKYIINDAKNPSVLVYLGVVSGTAYQMGYAMGTLFKDEIKASVGLLNFFMKNGKFSLTALPEWMQMMNMTNNQIVDTGLSFEQIATNHYTPQRFIDEIQGIANASGMDLTILTFVNLFPELIRAHCSVGGMWGNATQNGKLIQLRSLDWDKNLPMNQFPLITIYHPTEAGSNHFANIGWPGMIGSLAGYSGNTAVSEADWLPDEDNETTIFGQPWMYVLRDVLQFGSNMSWVINFLENVPRTYKIYAGVGSGPDNLFRGFQYVADNLTIYSDQNWSHPFSSVHPQFNGIMYWDKSSAQNRPCFGQVFNATYGNITAEFVFRQLAPLDQTGDTMVAVYDFGNNVVWLSFSSPEKGIPAYERPPFFLNMTQLFALGVNDEEEDYDLYDDYQEIFN